VVDGSENGNPVVSLADEAGTCKSAMADMKKKLSEPGMDEPDNDKIMKSVVG
jgi:hypothetical protein